MPQDRQRPNQAAKRPAKGYFAKLIMPVQDQKSAPNRVQKAIAAPKNLKRVDSFDFSEEEEEEERKDAAPSRGI